MEVAGVAEAERTPERAAACEAALAPALRRCYAETAAVARRLKEERGMVVGVISNHLVTPGLFGYCAEGAGLHALVSHPSLLLVSQAVGVGKPDPAIFALFFERLRRLEPGVAPAELLFVDDKPANVEAARSLGWRGLVFSSKTAPAGGFAAECAALGLVLPGSAPAGVAGEAAGEAAGGGSAEGGQVPAAAAELLTSS
mmetsp:Transcript_15145/g.50319  ORF Transcript_15145/g.50319 Transcript_15145/m.50319 type:complete len:199 (-) Transcript_15145:304-900(-)